MPTFKFVNRACEAITLTAVVIFAASLGIALLTAIINGVLTTIPVNILQAFVRLAVYLYLLSTALHLLAATIITVALVVTLLRNLIKEAK